MQILIYENSTINYIKDFDSIEIQKNKCAFDFSRKIIPHLKRWMPAKESDRPVAAIAKIKIKPFYLVNSNDDVSTNKTTNPTYIKGMQKFLSEVRFILNNKITKNEGKVSTLTFEVNEDGEMEAFNIDGNFSENDKKDMIKSLSKIKGKWNPATFNNIPFRTKMRQPILQNFDEEAEYQEKMRLMRNNRYK